MQKQKSCALSFKIILTIFLFVICAKVKAQIPTKAVKQFQKANKYLLKKDSAQAIVSLNSAIAIYPAYKEAYLALYTILIEREDKNALLSLEKASKLEGRDKPNLLFQLGTKALAMGDYTISNKAFGDYISLNTNDTSTRKRAEYFKNVCQYALNQLKMAPVKIEKQALLHNINTPSPEYLPSLDATSTTMVFTRRIQGNEDLFIATKKDNNDPNWTEIKPWLENTLQNEGAHTISADGKTIVFTKCQATDGFGSCDLYISEWLQGKWSKPRNMGSGINSTSWDSQPTLSANGATVYFSSNRSGGIGGYDIWRSEKINGRWQKAKVESNNINTAQDEMSPFLHAAGRELYFRSNGILGFGSFDLFVTKRANNSWQPSQNMGAGINDFKDQGSLIVSVDGKKAYYTDQQVNLKNQLVSSDLVSFDLPSALQSSHAIFLKGKVFDATSKNTLANVPITLQSEKDTTYRVSSLSDIDGEFLLIVPMNEYFQVFAKAQGYDFYSDRVYSRSEDDKSVQYNIHLHIPPKDSIVSKIPLILKNVLFEYNSFVLLTTSYNELNAIAEYLIENPSLQVVVTGHTDNIGNVEFNNKLSLNRAESVKAYLLNKGIKGERIAVDGQGSIVPIATNDTEAGREQNRRVEILLRSKK